MKKVAVVSDSFKGSITSREICDIVAEETLRFFPTCEVVQIPVADGGEGTVDSFLSCMPGEKIIVEATGPNFEKRSSFYGIIGETAIIEMAAVAGLPLVGADNDPSKTTTYGVGELMRHALSNGAKRIILGLGGSATNDGGCGAAAAMGTVFSDMDGNEFLPTGSSLSKIEHVDVSNTRQLLHNVEVIAMCDIDNPMHGKHGAAYIFGPQKGADTQMVERLDDELIALDALFYREMDLSIASLPGTGAAGAMGAGVIAFFNATLKPGIETILDTGCFEERVAGSDLVITGEGKLDSQSLRGKVVNGVARRSKEIGVPVIAVVGDVGEDIDEVYQLGVTAVLSTNQLAIPFQEAKRRSKQDYRFTISNLMRIIRVLEGIKEIH